MPETKIISLPYLHDHHSHVSLYASLAGTASLETFPAGTQHRPAALEFLARMPKDRLSLVTGWHSDRLPLDSSDLENLPPLLIVNASLHGFKLSKSGNAFAAELWPELAQGAQNPRWIESNLSGTFGFYTKLAGFTQAKLENFMKQMEALGIASLEDMSIPGEAELEVIAASPYSSRLRSWATPAVYRSLSKRGRNLCSGVKLFLDGALGGRSASLDAPFLGGEAGLLLYSSEELRGLLREFTAQGAAFAVHALAHRAIEQLTSCLESLGGNHEKLPQLRIEHAQFISLDQALRLKKLGVRLSMQPNFNSDSVDFQDRLSPRHQSENDPFRMLIDQAGFVPGEDLLFGSDGMPHGPEYALRWSLFPAFEAQRLSPEEFIEGYRPYGGWKASLPGTGSVFEIDHDRHSLKRLG